MNKRFSPSVAGLFLCVVVSLLPMFARAAKPEGAPKVADEVAVPKVTKPLDDGAIVERAATVGDDARWLASAHFSYLDLMLPGKFGIAVGRTSGLDSVFELEYTKGSFTPFFIDDLGKFSETRISFVRRNGQTGLTGFQWFYGVFYHQFKLEIGNALLSRLTTYYPSADVLSISGIGGMIGLGYRWLLTDSFLIGIDAVTYSQPLFTLTRDTKFLDVVTNQNDRDKVEAGVTAMQWFPRLAVAKLTFGYAF